MFSCPKCGTEVEDGSFFCPSCHTSLLGAQPQQQPPQNQQTPPAGGSYFSQKFQKFTDTPDSTTCFDSNDIQQNKVMAALAYLWWLVLIPLFAAKQSPFARYHVKQGLVLAILETVDVIAYVITMTIFLTDICTNMFIKIFILLFYVFFIVLVALSVLGFVNAAHGKAKELPIIGRIKIIK